MSRPITGVHCAAFTAFDAAGRVDPARTAAHARALLSQGCSGVALLGTTGEANSLSMAERQSLLEAVIASGAAADRLLPGTSACSVPETIELTRHARSCGVDAVLLLPPFYYPNPSLAGLLDFYGQVIEASADGDFRVLLYHIPQMTGVPITPELIAGLCERFPGVIAGVKDSSGDFDHMRMLAETFPDLAVLAGADHLVGPLLRAGGAGCITATSNLIAPRLVELHDRIRNGEDAEATAKLEQEIADTRALFQRWPQIPALKAAHALRQEDPAWAHVRPPMQDLDAGQQAALRQAMIEAGMLGDQSIREECA